MLSIWKTCCSRISQRWIFALLAFFGLGIGNALRAILSITITEMVPPVKSSIQFIDDTCPNLQNQSVKNVDLTIKSDTVYDWDEYTQGLILSSVYWGYASTQFFYGSLSERFGGKYFLAQSIFVPAIVTFITPWMVEWGGSTALIILRIIMGVTSSAMYPAANTMIFQWTTAKERVKLGNFVLSGFTLGPVFGTVIPALIIRYSGMGWKAVFYFFGVVGMIWFLLWMFLCYNNPIEHPYITDDELNYLRENLQKYKKPPPAPYKQIFMSKRYWAFVIGMTGCDWSYFTMASDLPKYMNSVVKFSIEDNGYLSSLPYLFMWLNTMFSSWINDKILEKKLMSLTNVRKLLATISTIGTASFILIASYAGCNQILVVTLFVTGMTLMGSSYPSLIVNPLDLSPNYAGTLMAIGNGIAALGGILTPYIVGVLTHNQTLTEWRLVFWINFIVAAVANVIFLFFGTGEIQKWNDPHYLRKKSKIGNTKEKDLNEEITCF